MQLRSICKSKIHHAIVTEANLEYIGSIGIDRDLMERANVIPGEKVSIWNVNNGERIETYALPAPAGSGDIIINGAAARRFREQDKIIIVAFVLTDEPISPSMILVNRNNQFVAWLGDNRMPNPLETDLAGPAIEP